MEPKIMCKSIKLMLEVRILRFHDLSCMTLSKVTDLICTLAKWLEVREAMGPVMWRNCLGKANVTAVKIITLHCTKQWHRLPAAVSEQIAQCVQEKGIKAWYFLQRRSPFKLNVRVDELLVWLSYTISASFDLSHSHVGHASPFTGSWHFASLLWLNTVFLIIIMVILGWNTAVLQVRAELLLSSQSSKEFCTDSHFYLSDEYCDNVRIKWMNLIALGKFSSALVPLYSIIQADISS